MKLLIDCCAFLPSLHGDFVAWTNRLWRALERQDAIDLRVAICPEDEEPLRAVLPEPLFERVLFVGARRPLTELFGDGRVPARWSHAVTPTPAMRLFREMVGVDESWSPDVVIANTPPGAIQAVWPLARIVFLEMHPFSRQPFPKLLLMDACSIVPTLASERSPLASADRDEALPASAMALVDGLKHAARDIALTLAPRLRIEPPLPKERSRPLAILPLPVSFGFSELVNGNPEACLERVCEVADACEGVCDLLITQHPLKPVLPPDVLAALLSRRAGVHVVTANDTGCAATNLLCASADLMINLGSKSAYIGLLFDLPVIEIGVSLLGTLGIRADVLTPADIGTALHAGRNGPAESRRRDRVLYTLVRHYACTERALSDPEFIRRRLYELLEERPIQLTASPWSSDEECAYDLEEALADAVGFMGALPSLVNWSLAWRFDLKELSGLEQAGSTEAMKIEGNGIPVTPLADDLHDLTAVSFDLLVHGTPYPYLPLLAFGQPSGSALVNRRMAIHWIKENNAVALSISTRLHGIVSVQTAEGSVPVGHHVHVEAHIDLEKDAAFILIDGSIEARQRLPSSLPPPATHLAIGVDLEWQSPPGAFSIGDLRLRIGNSDS